MQFAMGGHMNHHRNWLLLMMFLAIASAGFSQTKSKIELLGARDLKFDKRMGVDAQRLIGDVKFRHQGALLYCDSAYLYNASNSLDAFGNVYLNQGDTLRLYSDKLNYNGDTRLVKVRNNVRLLDKDMTLTTDILDYDRLKEKATFYEGGTIVSTANNNTLDAVYGVYMATNEIFYFRDDVLLTNPQYKVVTDTLDYHNITEVAYFDGPTFIYSDANTIYCENGWYDTKNDIAQFNENAYLDNGKQTLKGDSLWYTRVDGLGKAYCNVVIHDTVDQYLIKGDFGSYDERIKQSLVTLRAQLIQYDAADSLYLHADTLRAVEHDTLGNLLYAYRGARFYRKDMQGAADSIFYNRADSTIYMYYSPAIWSDDLQITGDTMEIRSNENGLERLLVYQNSMLIDRVDSGQFNQIKGRRLTGYFVDNDLETVFIEGNGQSLYYALEERKIPLDSLQVEGDTLACRIEQSVVGVNKAICSNIKITLEERKVLFIDFLVKPDGQFIPIPLFNKDESLMDGFTWQEERKPKDQYDIFRKAAAPPPKDSKKEKAERKEADRRLQ